MRLVDALQRFSSERVLAEEARAALRSWVHGFVVGVILGAATGALVGVLLAARAWSGRGDADDVPAPGTARYHVPALTVGEILGCAGGGDGTEGNRPVAEFLKWREGLVGLPAETQAGPRIFRGGVESRG